MNRGSVATRELEYDIANSVASTIRLLHLKTLQSSIEQNKNKPKLHQEKSHKFHSKSTDKMAVAAFSTPQNSGHSFSSNGADIRYKFTPNNFSKPPKDLTDFSLKKIIHKQNNLSNQLTSFDHPTARNDLNLQSGVMAMGSALVEMAEGSGFRKEHAPLIANFNKWSLNNVNSKECIKEHISGISYAQVQQKKEGLKPYNLESVAQQNRDLHLKTVVGGGTSKASFRSEPVASAHNSISEKVCRQLNKEYLPNQSEDAPEKVKLTIQRPDKIQKLGFKSIANVKNCDTKETPIYDYHPINKTYSLWSDEPQIKIPVKAQPKLSIQHKERLDIDSMERDSRDERKLLNPVAEEDEEEPDEQITSQGEISFTNSLMNSSNEPSNSESAILNAPKHTDVRDSLSDSVMLDYNPQNFYYNDWALFNLDNLTMENNVENILIGRQYKYQANLPLQFPIESYEAYFLSRPPVTQSLFSFEYFGKSQTGGFPSSQEISSSPTGELSASIDLSVYLSEDSDQLENQGLLAEQTDDTEEVVSISESPFNEVLFPRETKNLILLYKKSHFDRPVAFKSAISCVDEECNETFSNSKLLLVHLLKTRGINYVCVICHLPIKLYSELKSHQQTNHKFSIESSTTYFKDSTIQQLEDNLKKLSVHFVNPREAVTHTSCSYEPNVTSPGQQFSLKKKKVKFTALDVAQLGTVDLTSKDLNHNDSMLIDCINPKGTYPTCESSIKRFINNCLGNPVVYYEEKVSCNRHVNCTQNLSNCIESLNHFLLQTGYQRICRSCYKPLKYFQKCNCFDKICFVCNKVFAKESKAKQHEIAATNHVNGCFIKSNPFVVDQQFSILTYAYHLANTDMVLNYTGKFNCEISKRDYNPVEDDDHLHVMRDCFQSPICVNEEQPFICYQKPVEGDDLYCGSHFPTCRSLLLHILFTHKGFRFICKLCVIPFDEFVDFDCHISEHEICPYPRCRDIFDNRDEMLKHQLFSHNTRTNFKA